MSITYQRCDESVVKMAGSLLKEFESHAPLVACKVKIDYVFAYAHRDNMEMPVGCAIKVHGRPANGVARILPLKQRAIGRGDGEITLDADWWHDATEKQLRALLDHELHHFTVKLQGGMPLRDDLGRPVLKMRHHDVEFGWFAAIAERHGEDSGECRQAKQIMGAYGQYFWPEVAAPPDHSRPEPRSLTR